MTMAMRDDPDPDPPPMAPEASAEDEDSEARRVQGRARMLSMWRAAVKCVTEAAQREAANNDPTPPPEPVSDTDLEGYGPPEEVHADPWARARAATGQRN